MSYPVIKLSIQNLRFMVRYNRLYPNNTTEQRRQLGKSWKRLKKAFWRVFGL